MKNSIAMILQINPKKIFNVLIFIIFSLEIANIIGLIFYFRGNNIRWFYNMFNLTTEGNIPTFYSSITIFISAILLGFIAFFRKKNNLPHILWLYLSLIFLFLSIDEASEIHERIGTIFEDNLNLTGFLSWGWVIPYGLLLLVFATIYFFKFLPQLPKKINWLFLISGIIYVFGAIGFEMLAAQNYSSYNNSEILDSIYYSIEEFFEMLGIALFIYSLLLYINDEISIAIKTKLDN